MSEAETPAVLAGALEETGLPAAAAAEPDGARPASGYPAPVEAGLAEPVAPLPAIGIGDQVEYCLAEGICIGEWRPAFVVRVLLFGGVELVNLQVLTDGANDYLVCPLWVMSVAQGDGPGRWRPRQTRAA